MGGGHRRAWQGVVGSRGQREGPVPRPWGSRKPSGPSEAKGCPSPQRHSTTSSLPLRTSQDKLDTIISEISTWPELDQGLPKPVGPTGTVRATTDPAMLQGLSHHDPGPRAGSQRLSGSPALAGPPGWGGALCPCQLLHPSLVWELKNQCTSPAPAPLWTEEGRISDSRHLKLF